MIAQLAFENSIQLWAEAALSNVVVIVSEQITNAKTAPPRPNLPFVTLKVNSVQTSGYDDESGPDANDNKTIKGPRIFVTEFQSFGTDALGVLDQLKTSLRKSATTELLGANDISVLSSTAINDITTKLETRFERRGAFEIRFAVGSIETDSVDVIETINVDYDIKDQENNTVLDESINIS